MTTDREDHASPLLADGKASEQGSSGCVLVVAGYSDVLKMIGRVVEETARRITMSPMLGDFVEVRPVSLGPRSGPADAAISRLARLLSRPRAGTSLHFFALALVDRSASSIERLISDCSENPLLAAIPLRHRGFATTDDRDTGEAPDDSIVLSPEPGWTARTLLKALLGYADDLLGHFAAAGATGLTSGELSRLRAEYLSGEPAAPKSRPPDPDEAVLLSSDTAESESERPEAEWPSAWRPSTGPPAPAPVWSGRRLPGAVPPAAFSGPSATPGSSAGSGFPLPRAQRWRSWPRAARGSSPGRNSQPAAGGYPTSVRLYLAFHTSPTFEASPELRGVRSLARALDTGLENSPALDCMLRAVPGPAGSAASPLQPAGHLSHRDLKSVRSFPDLGRLLSFLRELLARDGRSEPMTGPPVIVLFAAGVPRADGITAKLYQELTAIASVLWVVTAATARKMSEVFTAGEGSDVFAINDYPGETAALIETVTGLCAPAGPAPSAADMDAAPAGRTEPAAEAPPSSQL